MVLRSNALVEIKGHFPMLRGSGYVLEPVASQTAEFMTPTRRSSKYVYGNFRNNESNFE
jgi:hypothetical protein